MNKWIGHLAILTAAVILSLLYYFVFDRFPNSTVVLVLGLIGEFFLYMFSETIYGVILRQRKSNERDRNDSTNVP